MCTIFVIISAVKCNDDYAVLKLLADIGANFDCASKVGDPVYKVVLKYYCIDASDAMRKLAIKEISEELLEFFSLLKY